MKKLVFFFTFLLVLSLECELWRNAQARESSPLASENVVSHPEAEQAAQEEITRLHMNANRPLFSRRPPSSASFRCQRPVSAIPDLQMLRALHRKTERGTMQKHNESGATASATSSGDCDFEYFKVVNAKVEVSNCTWIEPDMLSPTLSNRTNASFSPLSSRAYEEEHRTREEAPSPGSSPSPLCTQRSGGRNPSSSELAFSSAIDNCAATVTLELELSTVVNLLLAYQYGNSSASLRKAKGKEKIDESQEEDVEQEILIEEEEDIWRYSIALFHTAAKGNIHYKGYNQNGYSMCCDLLSPSSFSSSSSRNSSSFCVWQASFSREKEEDENVEETDIRGGHASDENDPSLFYQTRYVFADKCPLPQIPRPMSSFVPSAETTSTRRMTGTITKPLPAFLPGEWLAKIKLWRTRYGAWERNKQHLKSEEEASFSGSPTANEDTTGETEKLPFMEDEENVELLGKVVIPFHVDEESIRKIRTISEEHTMSRDAMEVSTVKEEGSHRSRNVASHEGREGQPVGVMSSTTPKRDDRKEGDSTDYDL